MPAIVTLCFVAVFAALGGFASAGLALSTAIGTPALVAAPLFGTVSLLTGLAAAWLVLMRHDSALHHRA